MSTDLFWCAVQVLPRHEARVCTLLSIKGYTHFVPMYKERHKWSDRYKDLALPLFPGYVFCSLQKRASAFEVFKTPGVVRVVSFGGKPCPIPDQEIENFKRICRCERQVTPSAYLVVGQKVQVICGPLTGIEGTLISQRNGCQMVIGIDIVMKAAAVVVQPDEVRAVEPMLAS